ncbi:uncharacterized protein LOC127834382 [Dreissena polymorpha]|uniref:uncharacterized protein LOC127834382 n=1 Tax=Dreissena polymorpha TaxID=45954 RepID=UPI002264B98F|nr:uncharacterized protein LOC127834382 [Dreissena polymorpha]
MGRKPDMTGVSAPKGNQKIKKGANSYRQTHHTDVKAYGKLYEPEKYNLHTEKTANGHRRSDSLSSVCGSSLSGSEKNDSGTEKQPNAGAHDNDDRIRLPDINSSQSVGSRCASEQLRMSEKSRYRTYSDSRKISQRKPFSSTVHGSYSSVISLPEVVDRKTKHRQQKKPHNTKLRNQRSGSDSNTLTDAHFHIDERKEKEKKETYQQYKSESKIYQANSIFKKLNDSVIGKDLTIETPFGQRQVVYCDYTASGKCLTIIEDYVRSVVMPTYANTHSTTGHNARQTGHFREEARNIIKQSVNASREDVVIFTGSGATAGMHKMAWALKINNPRVAMETVVLIGPYEHHSNILLWREFGAKVIRIRQKDASGLIDIDHLIEELQFWKEKRNHLLVCVSAASNVTGIITDVNAVSRIAHQHGAYAIFDYAAGGPYLDIDMNPSKDEYKDAVILSPHKFIGGPGTPGLVIAKKWLFKNSVPDRVGGGTVNFVTREIHGYVSNIEEREEGGTPAIIESIRAGLVFKLKQEIGFDVIHAREQELCNRAFNTWEKNPCIYILGNHKAERVPIFAFLTVHEETGRLVHHNYMATLLNDVFGIQARAGCACAGPYVEDLLGMPESQAKKFASMLLDKPFRTDISTPRIPLQITKPGFTRVNLTYFLDNETADYVIDAVDMATRYGWKLLPQYTFDIRTGSWRHKSFSNTPMYQLETLEDFGPFWSPGKQTHDHTSFKVRLQDAKRIFESATVSEKPRITSACLELQDALPTKIGTFRWFLTPHEAATILSDKEGHYLEKSHTREKETDLNQPPVTLRKSSDVSDGTLLFKQQKKGT